MIWWPCRYERARMDTFFKQKKAAESQRLFINDITIVGAQEGTRTPTKLLAST